VYTNTSVSRFQRHHF